MRKLSTALLIAGTAVVIALTGCGGGGGSSAPPVNNPGEVTVTGTVRDDRSNPLPVQGVTVWLNGEPRTTGADGTFSFTLSSPPALLIIPTEAYFYVSTSAISQTDYPTQYGVIYDSTTKVTYPQTSQTALSGSTAAKIPIPSSVYNAAQGTVSLGVITVKFNDPTQPPRPPDLP